MGSTDTHRPLVGLIDGDIFAYQAAASVEVETNWDGDLWTLHSSYVEGLHALEEMLDDIKTTLHLDRFRIALSDSENWRTTVLPTYKSHRKKIRKPIIYAALKDYLREKYGAESYPTLEGDDILGLWQTAPNKPYDTVIITTDKDLHTIPGKVCRWLGECPEIVDISTRLADFWHLRQALTGDSTDGYPGCPGVGPVKADKLLDKMLETTEAELPIAQLWSGVIVSAYKKAGLSEEVALQNARVARILRYGEFAHAYQGGNGMVQLWTP